MFLKKEINLLIIILFITGILRFFNLMHDSPYFFNPDERNMANAISQFRLPAKLTEIPICLISQISPLRNDPGSSSGSNDPGSSTTNDCNLNPHFFAYGQFPLYLAFASDQTIKSFWQVPVLVGTRPESDPGQARMTSFPSAIFWLRFWSALSSVLTIVLVYLITQKLLINNLNSSHSGKRGTSASRISIGFWTPARKCYASSVAGGSQNDNPGLNIGHYAAILAAFSPGLIQSAHFGTTESLLTFFFMASVYISLRYLSDLSRLRFILFSSLVIGLATGSKLTGIFFFIPPLTVLMIKIIQILKKQKKNWFFVTLFHCSIVSLLIIGSIIIFILSSPYNLVEPESFKSAVFGYEGDVAMGKYEAFYTRQFVNTTPVIFQAEKIFPYALGWPVFILGSIGILLITVKLLSMLILSILRKAQSSKLKAQIKKVQFWDFENWGLFGILIFGFWIYFIPNAFLFAKWTRFMTPILPFFAIFAGYFLFVILGSVNDSRIDSGPASPAGRQARMTIKFVYWFIGLLVPLSGIMPGLMFMSIYTHEDSRVSASKWIYKNLPNNSYVLSETANVVDIPLGLPNNETMKQWNNAKVISFDFYHMDENPMIFNDLLGHLQKANYIFIPSRRIFANYTKLPQKYPLATKYYQLLFSGALGFDKINETSSFPQIPISQIGPISLIGNDENAEETSTVFDHPVVRIYHKTKQLSQSDYRSLFETK